MNEELFFLEPPIGKIEVNGVKYEIYEDEYHDQIRYDEDFFFFFMRSANTVRKLVSYIVELTDPVTYLIDINKKNYKEFDMSLASLYNAIKILTDYGTLTKHSSDNGYVVNRKHIVLPFTVDVIRKSIEEFTDFDDKTIAAAMMKLVKRKMLNEEV